MSNNIEMINGIEVDTKKAKRIIIKLIGKEKKNLKTKEKGDSTMVGELKKMIKEEVECY